MNYGKPWSKAVNKLNAHSTLPIEQWDYYQLLGYLLSHTKETFEPMDTGGFISTNPSRHPLVESMRWVSRQFQDMREARDFLDWALQKRRSDLKVNALRILLAQYQTTTVQRKRTDPLPSSIRDLFSDLHVANFGDLSFLWQAETELVETRLKSRNLTPAGLQLDRIY